MKTLPASRVSLSNPSACFASPSIPESALVDQLHISLDVQIVINLKQNNNKKITKTYYVLGGFS